MLEQLTKLFDLFCRELSSNERQTDGFEFWAIGKAFHFGEV